MVERYFDVVIPATAFQALTREEVDPQAFGQIDVATIIAVHYRSHEELRAEVILVVDMPHLTVVRMMEQQGANQRITTLACLLRLLYDIRKEGIAQLPPTLDNGCDMGIMPGLALASAVIAHVAGEDTKLSPANIDILVEGRVHEIRNAVESRYVVTPESKA